MIAKVTFLSKLALNCIRQGIAIKVRSIMKSAAQLLIKIVVMLLQQWHPIHFVPTWSLVKYQQKSTFSSRKWKRTVEKRTELLRESLHFSSWFILKQKQCAHCKCYLLTWFQWLMANSQLQCKIFKTVEHKNARKKSDECKWHIFDIKSLFDYEYEYGCKHERDFMYRNSFDLSLAKYSNCMHFPIDWNVKRTKRNSHTVEPLLSAQKCSVHSLPLKVADECFSLVNKQQWKREDFL